MVIFIKYSFGSPLTGKNGVEMIDHRMPYEYEQADCSSRFNPVDPTARRVDIFDAGYMF